MGRGRDDQGNYGGQGRDTEGKYTRSIGSTKLPRYGDDVLDRHIQYKTTSQEAREDDILFDQHRKLFGWKSKSDMYRDQAYLGRKQIVEAIPNPDPELVESMELREVELDAVRRMTRHQRIDRVISVLEETIADYKIRRDWAGIRRAMKNAKASLKSIKDPVLRDEMSGLLELKFKEIEEEVDRPMSMDPKKFVKD